MDFHDSHKLSIKTFSEVVLKNNHLAGTPKDSLLREANLQECHLFADYHMANLSDDQLQCFYWAMKEELSDYDYFVYSRASRSGDIVEYVLLRCDCDIPLSNDRPHLDESIIHRADVKNW